MARLASEKLKKPSISIELWKEVLQDGEALGADDSEALSELEKLYEREKAWADLGAILDRQAQQLPADKRGASLLKLALLYTEKVQDVGKAVGAWRSLLDTEPDNRRAQDALRKLYIQQKDWDALEGFYASQNKWDEFIRVLERQAESEDDRTKVGLWLKIGQLYRDRLNKADRAQKALREGAAAGRQQPGGGRGPDPVLREGQGRRPPGQRPEGAAGPHHRAAGPPGADAAAGRPAGDGRGRQDGGAGDRPAGVLRRPGGGAGRASTPNGWPAETGSWADLVSAYEEASNHLEGPAGLAVLKTLARAYERELANPEAAMERNRAVLAISPSDPDSVLALERLYVATGRHAELLAIYDKKLSMARTDSEKRQVRFQLASLYEDEIRDHRARPSRCTATSCKSSPNELPALRALDRLYRGTQQWPELVSTVERELELATEPSERAELMFRMGQVQESQLDERKKAVESYRDALQLDPSHAGARAALEGFLSEKKLRMTAVEALEPIYEKGEDLARLIEVLRIRLEHARDTGKRVQLQLRVGALESAMGRAEASFDAYAEAFREEPASQAARMALEDLADNLGRWDALVELYGEALSAPEAGPVAGARAAAGGGGGLRPEAGQQREGGGVLPARPGHRARRSLGAGGAGAAVHPDRALARPGRDPAQEGPPGGRGRASASASTCRSPRCSRRPSATPTRPSPPGKTCWVTTRPA